MKIERLLEQKFSVLRKDGKTITPDSKYFGEIGSTSCEDIDYQDQLRVKKEIVKEIFSDSLELENCLLESIEIEPSSKIYEYRFKMDFVCAFNPIYAPHSRMGQRKKGKFNWVVDMDECNLISKEWFKKIRKVYELMIKNKIQNYDLKTSDGDLRYLVSKIHKNEAMLTIITKDNSVKKIIENAASQALKLGFKSVYWQVQPRQTDLSKGENEEFFGTASITIDVKTNAGTFYFKVGPNSFFQNNIYTFENILNYIIDQSKDLSSHNQILFDLYCGTGTIGIPLASKFKKVIGIDIEEESIKNAKENAKLNIQNNMEFFNMDVSAPNSPIYKEFEENKTVIIDPPRTGAGKNGVQAILSLNPKNIIYISCNPETQIKDLVDLKETYKIKSIRVFDMFPHTDHIENVVILERI